MSKPAKSVNRFDSQALDSEPLKTRCDIIRLDDGYRIDPKTGYLHFSAYTARPGIYVYQEKMDNGQTQTLRELVRKETLHDPSMMAGLNSKPVLDEHYFENGDGVMINAKNAKGLARGMTMNDHRVAEDGERTRIDGVIYDHELVDAVDKKGKRQLSPGYGVRLDETGGNDPVYGQYDREQVYRDYNHLAVTWKARGG